MDLQTLIDIDRQVLLFFNGSDSLFLDGLITTLTSGMTWIPLYIGLLYLAIKNNETVLQILLTIGCALLCVFLASMMANVVAKPLVMRPRPGNDLMMKYVVDVVDDMRGMDYSFFSAHAANTFSLAVFFCLLVRNKLFTFFLMAWSFINCYTRLYLGMHYPSDILVGLLWGAVVGISVHWLYFKLYFKISPKLNYVSSQYTSTGYSHDDIDVVVSLFVLCLLYAVIKALFIL